MLNTDEILYYAESHKNYIKQFKFANKHCVILKNHFGCYCGYVETESPFVPSKMYENIDVHGGVTFTGTLKNNKVECPEDTVFVGFDCMHCGDETPFIKEGRRWTEDYVTKELKKFCKEVIDVEHKYRFKLRIIRHYRQFIKTIKKIFGVKK